MAKKIVQLVEYVDDLTGDALPEDQVNTVRFGWDGVEYEIDLGQANAKKLEEMILPYVESGRRVSRSSGRASGGASKRPGTGSGRSKEELANIREWAGKNGHEVSPRGRIPAPVLEAYDEAHKG
ncbi:Lsr2 family protein [Rhodococcus hoagii]|nr:Lsr2 family protein [Prescottella equi]